MTYEKFRIISSVVEITRWIKENKERPYYFSWVYRQRNRSNYGLRMDKIYRFEGVKYKLKYVPSGEYCDLFANYRDTNKTQEVIVHIVNDPDLATLFALTHAGKITK